MLFMNEYEIEDALRRVDPEETPNLAGAIVNLANLAAWTNANSDGWPYWSKPCRAAKSLQALIQGVDRYDPEDVLPTQVSKALSPVKAFLTRQGVSHDILHSFSVRLVQS